MSNIVNFNSDKENKTRKAEPGEPLENFLAREASMIRHKAYAPYSKFLVGAAIASDAGIHVGANVENASYGCGVCAEASAISAMVSAGGKTIRMICVSGQGEKPVTPCGNCRQKIREFSNKDTAVIIANEKGDIQIETTLNNLLPFSFGPEYLS